MIQEARDIVDFLGLAGHGVFFGPVMFGVVATVFLVQLLKSWRSAKGRLPLDSFEVRLLAFVVAFLATLAAGLAVAAPIGLLCVYAAVSGVMAPTIVRVIKAAWRKRFPKPPSSSGEDGPDDTTMFGIK